ncbi:MAG: sigma-54-dependent Fis family transcriptional regulator [bacterium]|nr:sigma-54-dependent Fis family transcriptional regulator [bacterium]
MSDRILVVDDEQQLATAMSRVLRRAGHVVDIAHDGHEAISLLTQRGYALVISDLRMPVMDGHELLKRARKVRPDIPFVIVTAYGTVESAVTCIRDGALNYLTKPFSPQALEAAVHEILGVGTRDSERPVDFCAEDPVTLEVLALARRAARTDATVLLEAESGAGKEIFARFIHRESARSDGPFVAVNCAAMPRELLEAELFGHCKGAFTGALRERRGHFELADGGTLLLDEVGEMTPDLQSRLLRVLQDRVVQRLGSERPTCVNVRVIAATNRRLRDEVAARRFREDLYYRLNVLPLCVPPLRDRPGDIKPLALLFARRYAGAHARLTPRALALLCAHGWPGNVRELENAIQRATILAGHGEIDLDHFDLQPSLTAEAPPAIAQSLEKAEWEAIRQALLQASGNRQRAAETLGISPRTLRHKLKCYRDDGMPVLEPIR